MHRLLAFASFLALTSCTLRLAGDDEVAAGTSTTESTGDSAELGTSETSESDTSGTSETTATSATDTDTGGPLCGNGVREAGEDCDGEDLGGASCTSLGWELGALACNEDCSYDENDCDTGNPFDPVGCTSDAECVSGQCYVVPFLGGTCGECNEDSDCEGGGCTAPNPFSGVPAACNMGELGGGCGSSDACQPGLSCSNAFELLDLILIDTCGECASDADCGVGLICAPSVELSAFAAVNTCIVANTLAQDSYCKLAAEGGNGEAACTSGICSTVDIMGIAQIGACGECNTDADCGAGFCVAGLFDLDTGTLMGSTCQ